jgi:monoamine oxidase
MLDVVIVGAGAAGIAAARRLSELGLSALLVEAKNMVGGRASTDNDTFGVPFDLGCYWFHSPEHNPLIAMPMRSAFAISQMDRRRDTSATESG